MRRLALIFAFGAAILGGAAGSPCADAPVKSASAPAAKKLVEVFPERFRQWGGVSPATPAPANSTSSAATSEAGLIERMERVYSDGKNQITLTIALFHDTSGAYQHYTAGLKPGMKPSTAGALSAVDDTHLIAQVGDLVAEIDNVKSIGEGDLQALIGQLHEHADPTPLPPVRAYLPEKDLVDGSQRYALGPAGFQDAMNMLGCSQYAALAPEIGFGAPIDAEVMTAQYGDRANRATLLLIEYPNPQLAEQHLHHLAGVLPAKGGAEPNGALERKGSLLSLVIAPSSRAYAAKLRQAINYETQVTWNEPSTTATDPPIMSTLVKIFVGTGVFMLFALVLGVAFGGVRVLTKKFFPGKVFDRPEQMEVLQLGLSGKRIDPSDFY